MNTKDDVLNELHTGQGILLSFDSIPEHLRDSEVATVWMSMRYLRRGLPVHLSLPKIPRRLINDALLHKAIELDHDALKSIKPHMAVDYPSMVLQSVGCSVYAYRDIDPSYRTEAMLDAIIVHANHHLEIHTYDEHTQWIRDLMTQERIDKVLATNFMFALRYGLHKMEWGALKGLLKKSYPFYQFLDLHTALHYVSRLIAEGEWPECEDEDSTPVKPKTLDEGVFRMMIGERVLPARITRLDSFYLYKAYVMTYPIADVVATMQAPERRKVLLEMYSTDELRPHAHLNRNLRGALLEEAIGL
jgi:hypothetical protein